MSGATFDLDLKFIFSVSPLIYLPSPPYLIFHSLSRTRDSSGGLGGEGGSVGARGRRRRGRFQGSFFFQRNGMLRRRRNLFFNRPPHRPHTPHLLPPSTSASSSSGSSTANSANSAPPRRERWPQRAPGPPRSRRSTTRCAPWGTRSRSSAPRPGRSRALRLRCPAKPKQQKK